MDYAVYHHGSSLDAESMDAELPKDTPADFCLDQLCVIRTEMGEQLSRLIAGPAGMAAALAYLHGVIKKCVEAGISEWMKQENDQGSITRGEDAIVLALQLVGDFLLDDMQSHRFITARQMAMRGQALLFATGRTHKTETQIAAEFGYTRANVSAVVKRYQRKLDLLKSRGMKSDEAVETYRKRATRVHQQRKEKEQQCKSNTQTHSFSKSWTSMSSNLKQPMPAPSN
jgi:predicted transcriptional regulator